MIGDAAGRPEECFDLAQHERKFSEGISTLPPFVLRLSKDERAVQENRKASVTWLMK
jgi:hypothetical protein